MPIKGLLAVRLWRFWLSLLRLAWRWLFLPLYFLLLLPLLFDRSQRDLDVLLLGGVLCGHGLPQACAQLLQFGGCFCALVCHIRI